VHQGLVNWQVNKARPRVVHLDLDFDAADLALARVPVRVTSLVRRRGPFIPSPGRGVITTLQWWKYAFCGSRLKVSRA
jgi:hypothetical protein